MYDCVVWNNISGAVYYVLKTSRVASVSDKPRGSIA